MHLLACPKPDPYNRSAAARGSRRIIFDRAMNAVRRLLIGAVLVLCCLAVLNASATQVRAKPPEEILHRWYQLILELVRHTPTYSPPVASRAFAYIGVTAFESAATGSSRLVSLAGQLNGLGVPPPRTAGATYDDAAVVNAAMATAVQGFFYNTGPMGQRAAKSLETKLRDDLAASLPSDVLARSEALGKAVAARILEWSRGDRGAVVENLGFPLEYELAVGVARWVPTSLIVQQQKPLLPNWGQNRTFAMPGATFCNVTSPPVYSEEKSSTFYREALEVYRVTRSLKADQREIARFWADDPMLSPTPPGHWISIALQILERDKADLEKSVDVLARLGVALADSFIACWQAKFQYDLLRPVTYIRRIIDPRWESQITTPPFPEYPSGHSTQSGAAAMVLTHLFGENFAFQDRTHERDGIPPRSFPSFWAAAQEAGMSRLYGGIHFRTAIERGLEQGRCVGAFAVALLTQR
jgi:PAP2 superfamily protein